MTDKLTELTIDRNEWARGESSSLLMSSGKMCCLGIAAKACGISDRSIDEVGEPCEITDMDVDDGKKYFSMLPFLGKVVRDQEIVDDYCLTHNYVDEWGEPNPDQVPPIDLEQMITVEQAKVAESLMHINDDSALSDEERERQIAKIFAENGVTVKFVG